MNRMPILATLGLLLALGLAPVVGAHFPATQCDSEGPESSGGPCDLPELDTSGCDPAEVGCVLFIVINWALDIVQGPGFFWANYALFVVNHCKEHALNLELCA